MALPPNRREQVARTIATSPLVKTALAGGDPNWGRILAAAGRAGVPFRPERAAIRMAGIHVYERGRALPFDEGVAHEKLMEPNISIVDGFARGKRARSRLDLRLYRGIRAYQRELSHINAQATLRVARSKISWINV